jgi:hypothetical protein
VVLDNLPSHKSARAHTIVRQRGGWFLFLPPYSLDLNPIEMAFAKIKARFRRIGARSIDALWKASGNTATSTPTRNAGTTSRTRDIPAITARYSQYFAPPIWQGRTGAVLTPVPLLVDLAGFRRRHTPLVFVVRHRLERILGPIGLQENGFTVATEIDIGPVYRNILSSHA